jgi:lipoprotein-releasing system ATP-binding protein
MMKIENVSMKFGERQILKDVSFEVKERSITVITGKSGSGKTTLLGIMSGLLKPDGGKVLFGGKNIYRWMDFRRSRFRNKTIGFIFQFFNLLPDLTAFQNIIYPAVINPFSKDIRGQAEYLIQYLGLSHIAGNLPGTLSGGELQRVAIARSIINRPRIVLADEPTGNLDEETANGIIRLFAEIRDRYNISFVIVTHEKEFLDIADAHYHVEEGKLLRMNDRVRPREAGEGARPPKKAAAKSAPAPKKKAAMKKKPGRPAPGKKRR